MPAFNARRVNSKREASFNTAAAATAIVAGIDTASVEWGGRTRNKRYLTGNLAQNTVFEQVSDGGTATIAGDWTIEDGVILLDSALAATTGAGTGAPYTWSFPFPVSTAPTLKTRTFEFYDGSSTNCIELNGAIVTSFQLAGVAGPDQVVTFSSDWEGCAVTAPAVTAGLSARTTTIIPTGKIKMYVDTAGGTVGTTEITSTLIGWTLACANIAHLKRFQSGTLSPTTYGGDVPDVTLTTQVEVNATSYAWVDANLTPGAVRLLQIGSTNAATTNKGLVIKGPFDPVIIAPVFAEDRDGNSVLSITWKLRLDTSTTNGGFTNSLGGIYVTSTTNAFADA